MLRAPKEPLPQPYRKPEDGFERRMYVQQKEANENFEQTLKDRIDASVRKTSDLGTRVSENLIRLFRNKSELITQQAIDMKRSQAEALKSMGDVIIMQKHEQAMHFLSERFKLAMEISGGKNKKIATQEELIMFAKTGMHLLENTDVTNMMGLDRSGKEIPNEVIQNSYIDRMARLAQNPHKLDPKDAEFIAREVRKLTRIVEAGQMPEGHEGLGIVLLAYLSPAQRMDLVRYMIHEPGTEHLITDLVRMDYLSRAQGETLFKEEIARLEKASEGAKRKAKKEIEGEIERAERGILDVNSPRTKEIQEKTRTARKKDGKRLKRRRFGHKNRAKELFSLEGIVGAAFAANGAMMVGGGVLANLYSPMDIVTNPMIILGAGMTAASLEFMDGYSGLAPTPSGEFAKLTAEKDEIAAEKREEATADMRRSLTNNRVAARCYYENTQKIIDAYRLDKRRSPDEMPKITLNELGINPQSKEYQEKYGSISPTEMEALLTQWARYFFDSGLGEKAQTERAQQRFVDNAFTLEGLDPMSIQIA